MPDGIKEEIAKNILFYRNKNNMSQVQLANMVGVSNAAVSNWEKGINSIDIETLSKVCEALKIDFNAVFGFKSAAYSIDETNIIKDYQSLTPAGQEYIRQTMDMAKKTYSKTEVNETTDGDDEEEYIYGRSVAYGGGTEVSKYPKKDLYEVKALVDKIVRQQAKERGELKNED